MSLFGVNDKVVKIWRIEEARYFRDNMCDKFEFVESDMTAFSKVEVFRYKATLHNGEVEHIFCLGMIGTK